MRYPLLDAFRGAAALAVTIFHCSNAIVHPGSSWWGDLLLFGWAGVFVFFPISGYCIAAAVSRTDNAAPLEFVRRRWRRIFPPYWASIAVTLVVGIAALAFNRGTLVQLVGYDALTWAAVLTLTQTLLDRGMVINPVYWSLCYEEQFYLVMAAGLLVGDRARWRLWGAVSVAAAAYVLAILPAGRVPGLFLEYWLQFALGMAVFSWFHRAEGRLWIALVGTLAVAGLFLVDDPVPLAISVATAVMMTIARAYEGALLKTAAVAWLGRVGVFSFSLYLIHIPIGGRVVNVLRRVSDSESAVLWIMPLAVAASVGAAWLFHHVVEKHFLNRPGRVQSPIPAPMAA